MQEADEPGQGFRSEGTKVLLLGKPHCRVAPGSCQHLGRSVVGFAGRGQEMGGKATPGLVAPSLL